MMKAFYMGVGVYKLYWASLSNDTDRRKVQEYHKSRDT